MGGITQQPELLDRRAPQQQFIPLTVAAAIAFHQAQRGRKAIQSPSDYIEALNIAAGALSRLIPIYVMDDGVGMRVTIDVELLHGEFTGCATGYRADDGSMFKPLSVMRDDLTTALSVMRRVGPTLAFAVTAPKQEAPASPEPKKEPNCQDSE